MIRLPDVNGNNWKKILRELDVAKFPSLPKYLVSIREKLLKKTELKFEEEMLGKAKLINYFTEFSREINSLYIQTIDWTRFKRPPLEHQKPAVEFLLKNNRCILGDDMGVGKGMQLSNTQLVTHNGLIPLRQLKVGHKIFGSDGKLHNVTGIFPQGKKDVYKVTFSDGTVSHVDLEHLWNVRSVNDKRRRGTDFWRTMATADLLNDLQYKNRTYKWEIPRCQPLVYPDIDFIIPPYVLGVLIADGSLTRGQLNICPGNTEILDIIESFIGKNEIIQLGADYGRSTKYKFVNVNEYYKQYIKSVGLDVIGDFKFIPDAYKYASIEQRKLLLQGLMDSDGTTLKGRTSYCTTSRDLAEDLVELVQSLGGMARIYCTEGRNIYDKNLGRFVFHQKSYRVNVQTEFCPFLRPYHIGRWKLTNKMVRNIVSIEYVCNDDTVCISVDSPDKLFLIEGHVLTHNTGSSIMAALSMEDRHKILVVTLKSLKYNFRKEITYYDDRVAVVGDKKWAEDKFTIVHYESLKKWQEQIKNGGFTVIICDEAHRIRNPKAQRTKFVMDFIKALKPLKIWLLTGTPIDNRPIDYYNLLKIIKHPVSKNWVTYVTRYCEGYKNEWGQWYTKGASNLRELHDQTKDVFLRRLKTNIGLELPNKTRRPIFLELKNRKEYDQQVELFRKNKYEKLIDEVDYKGSEENVKVEDITVLLLHRQFCALEKIRDGSLIEIIENMLEENDNNKILVFTNFTKVVDAVQEKFGKICVSVDGRILNVEKRQAIVDRFNEDPSLRIMVMNQVVGGTGYNIQAANKVIVPDLNWVPSMMLQCEDRAYRIGVKHDVEVLYPIYDDTVETVVYQEIEKKMEIISTVVEGKASSYFEETVKTDKKTEMANERKELIEKILAQLGI